MGLAVVRARKPRACVADAHLEGETVSLARAREHARTRAVPRRADPTPRHARDRQRAAPNGSLAAARPTRGRSRALPFDARRCAEPYAPRGGVSHGRAAHAATCSTRLLRGAVRVDSAHTWLRGLPRLVASALRGHGRALLWFGEVRAASRARARWLGVS